MPGYWLARAKVRDPENYKRYTDRVPDIMAKYNAKVIVRGGENQIMEGPKDFNRFVVIEFPSMQDAVDCFNSEEYQTAAGFRRDGSGDVEIAIVEGI
ncbi:MAG: DUF1330 domain-containing protein [Methyloligellaceae bacterium]